MRSKWHYESYARRSAGISVLPFGAIAAGRHRLALREIGRVPPVIELVAWAVLHFHRSLFGVARVLMG